MEVTGVPAATAATIGPATLVLNVTAITLRASGGCLTTAAALNGQTSVPTATSGAQTPQPGAQASNTAKSAPTATRGGMSTGAKVGIIGAVAGGGAGAALALGGKKSTTSP